MHLVIFGSIDSGKIVINADGIRVTLMRSPAGEWTAAPTGTFKLLQTGVERDLGPLLALLAPVEGGHVDAEPLTALRLVVPQ